MITEIIIKLYRFGNKIGFRIKSKMLKQAYEILYIMKIINRNENLEAAIYNLWQIITTS